CARFAMPLGRFDYW
nr:immunoglobulin heavy chain junction region [Macaca mulatta]MOY25087.1 immunoglobulin heavy chain junction region [Macaca mulatta]